MFIENNSDFFFFFENVNNSDLSSFQVKYLISTKTWSKLSNNVLKKSHLYINGY